MNYLRHGNKRYWRTLINRVCTDLQPVRSEFNSIVVTGLSGELPGAILANMLYKDLVVVRKPGINSHGMPVEGSLSLPYIIVDDFIASGDTVRRIVEAVTVFPKRPCMPKYIVLINEGWCPEAINIRSTKDIDGKEVEARSVYSLRKVPGSQFRYETKLLKQEVDECATSQSSQPSARRNW